MSGLKRKEEEIGLVELDADKAEETADRKEHEFLRRKRAYKKRNVRLALACIIAGSLTLILLGTLLFHIPLIAVGIVVVLEAGIAAALNNSDFWVHIAVMAAQAFIGILCGQALLMILAAGYYFILLVALKLIELDS